MRVWTNGECAVLFGSTGLMAYRREGARLTLASHVPGDWLASLSHRAPLLVARDAETAWVRDGQGQLLRVRLGRDAEVQPLRSDVVDLVATGDGGCCAVLAAQGAPSQLVLGRLGPEHALSLDRPVPLPAPERVTWPDDLWGEPQALWSDAPLGAGAPARAQRVCLHHGPHGLGVADEASGIVALVHPEAGTVTLALRLPSREEVRMYAAATPQGALVSLTRAGRSSAVLCFARDGRCLARHTFDGALGPFAFAGPDEVLVPLLRPGGEGLQVLRFDLATLEPRAPVDTELDASDAPELHVAEDGVSWLASDGRRAAWAHRTGAHWKVAQVLDPTHDEAASPEPQAPGAEASEPAILALSESPSLGEGWKVQRGSPLRLSLPLRNIGGTARALSVQLSGPAIESGLLSPKAVAVAGREGLLDFKLSRRVVLETTLSNLLLSGDFELQLQGEAARTGRADLQVHLGLPGQRRKGQLTLRIPISVESHGPR